MHIGREIRRTVIPARRPRRAKPLALPEPQPQPAWIPRREPAKLPVRIKP